MVLLKTILIILLVYYLFKILLKWFGPKLFSYAAKKTQERFKEQFEQFNQENQNTVHEDGDVIIDKKPRKKSNPTKKVGEYIDFEEIE
ncbi:DUF4834 family protein [Costertonia aggregata]|uniref:DUF4834 family protein n=1 Tax=Costertonia aggregata TaxID=343403 RepID=A0A7H9AUL2_9FLAO|nr:DUF4834 family protein [Costertonia aggregata]QLG47126.1 DUF4834 family protein [Costertonia aggregata]